MAECSEIANTAGAAVKEEILAECEHLWKQMEECKSKLVLQRTKTLLKSDAKHSLLILQWKALTADYEQWQARNPEIISTSPDVLLELGKEELQKVKNDLEMLLSTVRVKNKQLDEELKREQQWYEEQKELLNTVTKIEEEVKTQAEQPPTQSLNTKEFDELKNKVLKLNIYKKELLSDLGAFLDEHFPPPEKGENKKKKKCSAKPAVELISLREIIEILINKMVSTPHDPYITINESFWPPYIEVLLRYGVALRHPEDPNRMRLEAFHK